MTAGSLRTCGRRAHGRADLPQLAGAARSPHATGTAASGCSPATGWRTRYGELFAYDEPSRTFSLDNPA
jgi:hypothetical protein